MKQRQRTVRLVLKFPSFRGRGFRVNTIAWSLSLRFYVSDPRAPQRHRAVAELRSGLCTV